MANLTRSQDGLNSVIEELKILGPDTREAMERYEQIEASLTQHSRELAAAISAARMAIRAINADVELLREETKGNTTELERRLLAIDRGAERLGYEFLSVPTLRVVVPLNGEPA